MMFNLIETVVTKDTPAGAAKVLAALMETCVDRLESLAAVLDEVQQRSERQKNGEVEPGNVFMVEKARPVSWAVYAADEPDNVLSGLFTEFPSLQHPLMRRQSSGFCSGPLHMAYEPASVPSRKSMPQSLTDRSC
jgi:transformation/transcription domain-associated protein